jgi:general stress protein 26
MTPQDKAPDTDDVARVWKLMEKIGVCMLVSRDGEKMRGRPMSAHLRREANVVHFLTDARGHKDEEVSADQHVGLMFQEPDHGKYLSLTGRARVSNDRALIRELWDTSAEARWQGPDDPGVRVIEVALDDAQFWEGPHGVVATFQMVVAAATSAPPVLGEQRKVDLS